MKPEDSKKPEDTKDPKKPQPEPHGGSGQDKPPPGSNN